MNPWCCSECGDNMLIERENDQEVDIYCPTCGYQEERFAHDLYSHDRNEYK